MKRVKPPPVGVAEGLRETPPSGRKPFSLDAHLAGVTEVTDVATRFELPAERVIQIASEVVEHVTISTTIRESEAREYLRVVYERELDRFRVCVRCTVVMPTMAEAIAHVRLHLLFGDDPKVARGVASDIELQLWPRVERTLAAALTPEERRRLEPIVDLVKVGNLLSSDVRAVAPAVPAAQPSRRRRPKSKRAVDSPPSQSSGKP